MDIRKQEIDRGTAFDFGKTAEDYAKYRDIYPPQFYDDIVQRGLCIRGQKVLDLGTGTGVLPRAMYHHGAEWFGTDISPEQIEQAKRLAENVGMDIDFSVASAEETAFPDSTFDIVTSVECYWYFDPERAYPNIARMLRPNGVMLILYMGWQSFEDRIAGESEKMILQYNPNWTGSGDYKRPIAVPDAAYRDFTLESHWEYDLPVHFTRDSWHGRMRASRGVGASLPPEQLAKWDTDHRALLERIAPPEFDILHYAAGAILRKK